MVIVTVPRPVINVISHEWHDMLQGLLSSTLTNTVVRIYLPSCQAVDLLQIECHWPNIMGQYLIFLSIQTSNVHVSLLTHEYIHWSHMQTYHVVEVTDL